MSLEFLRVIFYYMKLVRKWWLWCEEKREEIGEEMMVCDVRNLRVFGLVMQRQRGF